MTIKSRASKTHILSTHQQAVDAIIAAVGHDLRVGTPLGLGKPNQLLNALYERVAQSPSFSLKIFTALSLEIPASHSDLEKRFAAPFLKRHFGENYPTLKYTHDLRHGLTPANIQIREFYTMAGQYLGNPKGQQDYTSLNYTHAARAIANQGVNVLVQLVARADASDTDGRTYRVELAVPPVGRGQSDRDVGGRHRGNGRTDP